jgi:hypothetical protein
MAKDEAYKKAEQKIQQALQSDATESTERPTSG